MTHFQIRKSHFPSSLSVHLVLLVMKYACSTPYRKYAGFQIILIEYKIKLSVFCNQFLLSNSSMQKCSLHHYLPSFKNCRIILMSTSMFNSGHYYGKKGRGGDAILGPEQKI